MFAEATHRNILRIKAKRTLHLAILAIKKISCMAAGAKKPDLVRTILIYPPISKESILGDILNRFCWYFPERENTELQVFIPLSSPLFPDNVDIYRLPHPDAQARFIQNRSYFSLIGGSESRNKLRTVDLILLWNASSLKNPFLLRYLYKTEIVDPYYYSSRGDYRDVYYMSLSSAQKNAYRQLSKSNYKKLLDSLNSSAEAYLFANGPSLNTAFNFSFDDSSLKVICNSNVRSKELLDHIKPHLLAIGDPYFFLGPSRYAVEYRQNMLRVILDYGCYCLVFEKNMSLLLEHYPELRDKIVGIPAAGKKNFNFPTIGDFYVRAVGNVLTDLMLPVASAITRNIYIIGADGQQKMEKRIWSYSQATRHGDLTQTVVDTHPSLFKNIIHQHHYEIYCEGLASLIEYGESIGKHYRSLTPSFIPTLKQRYASKENRAKI